MEWKQRNIRLRRSESLHCWNKYTMWSYDTERKLLIFLQHNDKEPFKRRRLEMHRRQSRRDEQ